MKYQYSLHSQIIFWDDQPHNRQRGTIADCSNTQTDVTLGLVRKCSENDIVRATAFIDHLLLFMCPSLFHLKN